MKKKRRDSWRNLAETFLPFLAATATAFLAVTLGVKKVGPALQLFSPLVLLICGIAWVAIYNVMFFLSIGKVGGGYRIKHVQLNLFARYALVALGVWIFLSWLTDLSGFDRFAAGFLDELTPGSQHFFLGTFYTFIPLALVSLFLRGEGLGIAYIHGILIGFFFLLLLSPAIFLYCGSFSLGIAFSWTVGTLLGCATGGPFSVWLGRRSVPGLPA